MAHILITGSSGFLGHNLIQGLRSKHSLVATRFRSSISEGKLVKSIRLDVTQRDAVTNQVERAEPDVVIHSAAISQPDFCEKHPEEARETIVEGTRNIVRASKEAGARVVHISTDLVFDGRKGNYTEEDAVHGINVYAQSKIKAENVVRDVDPSAVILRVALLYGMGSPNHPGFIASVLSRWRDAQPVTFYADQYRTPLAATQVAECIEVLLKQPEICGTFHLGGADRLSRYDFGVLLADEVGVPVDLVRPASMQDAQSVAPRGVDCSLDSAKLRRTSGFKPLSCVEGLKGLVRSGQLRALAG